MSQITSAESSVRYRPQLSAVILHWSFKELYPYILENGVYFPFWFTCRSTGRNTYYRGSKCSDCGLRGFHVSGLHGFRRPSSKDRSTWSSLNFHYPYLIGNFDFRDFAATFVEVAQCLEIHCSWHCTITQNAVKSRKPNLSNRKKLYVDTY
jgi:hypothetical protein